MTRRACQRFALVPSVLLAAGLVFAEEAEAKWETIVKGSITVKNRARPESAVKEVWAQGEIAAPLQDIQATLVNPGNFKNFMPYLKGSWEIHKPEADGSVYVYTQLDFPMLTDRDYVVRVWLDEGVTADGTGAFRQHWVAVPDKIPSRANLIRVRVNDGSWDIRPLGDGRRCWAIYKFAIDPGGWVPAWAANMGNEQGVTQTYKAIEKEAQRLAKERLAKAAANPPVHGHLGQRHPPRDPCVRTPIQACTRRSPGA